MSIFSRTALILAAACLAGCSDDTREADTKVCIARSQHQTQAVSPGASTQDETAEESHDRIGGLIATCMEERGYRHDNGAMTDDRCVDDVDYNPHCYLKRK